MVRISNPFAFMYMKASVVESVSLSNTEEEATFHAQETPNVYNVFSNSLVLVHVENAHVEPDMTASVLTSDGFHHNATLCVHVDVMETVQLLTLPVSTSTHGFNLRNVCPYWNCE